MDILHKKNINKPRGLIPIANIYKKIDTKILKAKKDKVKTKKKDKRTTKKKEHLDYKKKKQKIKDGIYIEFHLKEPNIKYHLRGDKVVTIQKKENIYINKRPIEAARKAFKDIARSLQLEKKSDQNVFFILVEYKNGKGEIEHHYIGTNTLSKPIKKTIPQNKGSNKIIWTYVNPKIKKVNEIIL